MADYMLGENKKAPAVILPELLNQKTTTLYLVFAFSGVWVALDGLAVVVAFFFAAGFAAVAGVAAEVAVLSFLESCAVVVCVVFVLSCFAGTAALPANAKPNTRTDAKTKFFMTFYF
jgi:hypothetical protein